MAKLVLVRHGQSQWNLENRFTGWVDVPLTPTGEQEARKAGIQLKTIHFDQAFTSNLQRAQRTLDLILNEIGQTDLSITKDQALNERHQCDRANRRTRLRSRHLDDEQVGVPQSA